MNGSEAFLSERQEPMNPKGMQMAYCRGGQNKHNREGILLSHQRSLDESPIPAHGLMVTILKAFSSICFNVQLLHFRYIL